MEQQVRYVLEEDENPYNISVGKKEDGFVIKDEKGVHCFQIDRRDDVLYEGSIVDGGVTYVTDRKDHFYHALCVYRTDSLYILLDNHKVKLLDISMNMPYALERASPENGAVSPEDIDYLNSRRKS